MSDEVPVVQRALAIFERGPDFDALHSALGDLSGGAYDAVLVALAERLREAPERASWLAMLEHHAFRDVERLGRAADRAVRAVERRRWEDETDPFEVLDDTGGGPTLDHLPSRLLWLLDPPAWCSVVDAKALPSTAGEFVFYASAALGELLDALRSAPEVYTTDARWTRSIAAITLIDRALDRLDARLRVERPEADPWDAANHGDLLALTGALEVRRDGHLLAVGFLARAMCRHGAEVRRLRVTPHIMRWAPHLEALLIRRRVAPAALEALLGARHANRERDVWVRGTNADRVVISRSRKMGSFDLLIAAASPVIERAEPQEMATHWSLVVRALREEDPGVREELASETGGYWEPRWSWLAILFARLPDPLEALDEARHALEPLFEQFSRDGRDIDAREPLLTLGLLACVAARVARQEAADRSWPVDLYGRALALLERVWIFEAPYSRERSERAVLLCIGFAQACGRTLDARDVAFQLRPLIQRPTMVIRAARRLHDHGASVETLRDALRRCDTELDTMCSDAREILRLELERPEERPDVEASLALLSPTTGRAPPSANLPFEGATQIAREGGLTLWRIASPRPLIERHGIAGALAAVSSSQPLTHAAVRWAIEARPQDGDDLDAELLVAVGPVARGQLLREVTCWDGAGGEAALASVLGEALTRRDPFDRRAPVRGNLHFGRESFVDELAGAIIATRMTGVFGLRRVGKTSAVHAALSRARDAVTPVWVDVQGIVRRDALGVAAAVARAALQAGGRRQRVEAARGGDAAQLLSVALDELGELERLSKRVPCVVFDEFDLLFADGERRDVDRVQRVLEPLASECAAGRLTLVAIGRDARRFQDARRVDADDRGLVGQMQARWLPPLSRADATHMLEQLGRRAQVLVSEAHAETAYQLAGGHPLLLRLYGRELFEASRSGSELPDVALARERFLERPDVVGLVGDALDLVAGCFPDEWRLAAGRLMAAHPQTAHGQEVPWGAAFERFGLVRDDGQLPDALLRLAPTVGPVVTEAA